MAEESVILRNTGALSASKKKKKKKMGTLVLLLQETEISQHPAVGHRGEIAP